MNDQKLIITLTQTESVDLKKSRHSIVLDNNQNRKNRGTCKEIHKEEELKYLLGEKWFIKRNVQVQEEWIHAARVNTWRVVSTVCLTQRHKLVYIWNATRVSKSLWKSWKTQESQEERRNKKTKTWRKDKMQYVIRIMLE